MSDTAALTWPRGKPWRRVEESLRKRKERGFVYCCLSSRLCHNITRNYKTWNTCNKVEIEAKTLQDSGPSSHPALQVLLQDTPAPLRLGGGGSVWAPQTDRAESAEPREV